MRSVVNGGLLPPLLFAGLATAGPPSAALAAAHDGNWSVLIITEKGECDAAYRYAVKVANGRVSYQGDASVDMAGTVAPNGAVKVSIRLGDKGANGTGRLSGNRRGHLARRRREHHLRRPLGSRAALTR